MDGWVMLSPIPASQCLQQQGVHMCWRFALQHILAGACAGALPCKDHSPFPPRVLGPSRLCSSTLQHLVPSARNMNEPSALHCKNQ